MSSNDIKEYIERYGQNSSFNWNAEKNIDIRNQVDEILAFIARRDIKTLMKTDRVMYRGQAMERFGTFWQKYPDLFNKIIDGALDGEKFDYTKFLNILNIKMNIEKGNISYEDANKKFGQDAYEQYVAPKLN